MMEWARRHKLILAVLCFVAFSASLTIASNRVRVGLINLVSTSYAYLSRDVSEPQFTVARVEGTGPNRIYLFHGMMTDEDQWSEAGLEPLDEIDMQRVYVRLVVDDSSYFTDDGARYCDAFRNWMNQTQAKLDAKSPANLTFAAGVSYGGLHSLLAAAELDFIDGFVALIPSFYVSRIPRYRFQSNDRCKPENYADYPDGAIYYITSDFVGSSDIIPQFARSRGLNARSFDLDTHRFDEKLSRASASYLRDLAARLETAGETEQ
ncbi:hypothetical protein [Qipengyuania sphaerica]|uniref:hypothetical protein n=1 Tax=Qipengyuania sphaerica TaxID=2867243 RepID=UPI001C872A2D|nr:hypothetical protein [Qipengyuania sphaerica]MBX7540896.1 hypothetical protein [Qipengyuania sphaerica]